MAGPLPLDRVAPDPVLVEALEQVGQGVAADGPQAPGGQLQAALPVLDEPGLGQHPGQLGQPLQAAGPVVAQQLPGHVEVDLGQGARGRRRRQQVLELVERAQPVHEVDRLGHAQGVACRSVWNRSLPRLARERGPQVLAEPVDLPAQVHVVEELGGQRLRAGPAARA